MKYSFENYQGHAAPSHNILQRYHTEISLLQKDLSFQLLYTCLYNYSLNNA